MAAAKLELEPRNSSTKGFDMRNVVNEENSHDIVASNLLDIVGLSDVMSASVISGFWI